MILLTILRMYVLTVVEKGKTAERRRRKAIGAKAERAMPASYRESDVYARTNLGQNLKV